MFEGIILNISGVVLPIIIFVSVILRYILHRNLDGLTEVVMVIVSWFYFCGGALATDEKSHISASIVDLFVKKRRTYEIVCLLREIVSLAMFVVMFKLAMDDVLWMAARGPRTAMLRLPQVICYIPIALCFILSTIYTIRHIIQTLTGIPKISPDELIAPEQAQLDKEDT